VAFGACGRSGFFERNLFNFKIEDIMSMIIGVTWASLELLLTDEELDDVDGADPATHAHALKCLHVPCNLP